MSGVSARELEEDVVRLLCFSKLVKRMVHHGGTDDITDVFHRCWFNDRKRGRIKSWEII